eukprot:1508655-Ditylum_brightwellii.AAC.1
MDKILPELYSQIKPENKLEKYEHPVRVIPKAARMQSTYVEALKNKYAAANLQEEATKYNKPPEHKRKIRAFALTMEEFPDLAPDEAVA